MTARERAAAKERRWYDVVCRTREFVRRHIAFAPNGASTMTLNNSQTDQLVRILTGSTDDKHATKDATK